MAGSETPTLDSDVDRRVYSWEDSRRAWAQRRADLQDTRGLNDLLVQIDVRAKELEQRTAAVLAQSTQQPDRRKPSPRSMPSC